MAEQSRWPEGNVGPVDGQEPTGPGVQPDDVASGDEELLRAAVAALEEGEGAGEARHPDADAQRDAQDLSLSTLERQRDEYLDALRRLQAEFDNYRKRVDRQQREILERAATALVTKLLPVLDTADLALAHGGGEEVKQVAGALFDVLAKEGLQRIVPEGQPFDPERHDAVAHEPAEGEGAPEVPEVSEVLRAGYEWKGRVLRPAMVRVRG
jgi:molecular chaperone GrpE